MLTRCMHCGEKAARRCKTGDCRHCDACGKDFIPCNPSCPGFFLNTDKEDGCPIEICDECVTESKVPAEDRLSDLDARGWPEAYRAAAKLLAHREREAKRPWSPPVAQYPRQPRH